MRTIGWKKVFAGIRKTLPTLGPFLTPVFTKVLKAIPKEHRHEITVLPADDPGHRGWVIYWVVNGKEVACYPSIKADKVFEAWKKYPNDPYTKKLKMLETRDSLLQDIVNFIRDTDEDSKLASGF